MAYSTELFYMQFLVFGKGIVYVSTNTHHKLISIVASEYLEAQEKHSLGCTLHFA